MAIIIGLDIGGSTTKIVGLQDGRLISKEWVKASDPMASAFGALGKFINQNKIGMEAIDRVQVTGVGASFLQGNLLGIRTFRTPEFMAIGLGGLYLTGLKEAVVVSMGTGTAFVRATQGSVEHLIGTGIGGGTMLGLSNRMINVRDFGLFTEMADRGDLSHIDLAVKDITRDELPGLPPETTASNFGKTDESASHEDIALGIVNMVFQSVGTNAVLAARQCGIGTIIFTGNLTLVTQGKRVLSGFSSLYNVKIVVPESAEYATAIGAALSKFDK